jgi:hypothetical protein
MPPDVTPPGQTEIVPAAPKTIATPAPSPEPTPVATPEPLPAPAPSPRPAVETSRLHRLLTVGGLNDATLGLAHDFARDGENVAGRDP